MSPACMAYQPLHKATSAHDRTYDGGGGGDDGVEPKRVRLSEMWSANVRISLLSTRLFVQSSESGTPHSPSPRASVSPPTFSRLLFSQLYFLNPQSFFYLYGLSHFVHSANFSSLNSHRKGIIVYIQSFCVLVGMVGGSHTRLRGRWVWTQFKRLDRNSGSLHM
jgi:hypothetical protein